MQPPGITTQLRRSTIELKAETLDPFLSWINKMGRSTIELKEIYSSIEANNSGGKKIYYRIERVENKLPEAERGEWEDLL